jgi:hypothetical protein
MPVAPDDHAALPLCRFCEQPVKKWAWRCGHCGSGIATAYQWGPRVAVIAFFGAIYLWVIVKYFGY